jgi:hypothetical protein
MRKRSIGVRGATCPGECRADCCTRRAIPQGVPAAYHGRMRSFARRLVTRRLVPVLFAAAALVTCAARPVAAVTDVAWRDYEDPSSTVTMQVPATWRAGKQAERGPSRIVTFKLPESGAELTLAIQPDLKRANELPASLARSYFPADALVESPRTSRGKGWLGLRQEAKATVGGKERAYVGQFFVFRSTLVAVLLSGDPASIEGQRATFERVALSIRYHEAAVDTACAAPPSARRHG